MRAPALLLLLAGCAAEPDERQNRVSNVQENGVEAPPGPPPSAEDLALSRSAADSLRLYYERIGRRDWSGAFAMREPVAGVTLERFKDRYEPYEDHRATIGTPSLPTRHEGAVWVQVPVQLYGRMEGGRPFGSVRAVVLKRGPGEERWRIVS